MKLRPLMVLVAARAGRRLGGGFLRHVEDRQPVQRCVRDHHVHDRASGQCADRQLQAGDSRHRGLGASTGTVDGSSAKWGYDVVFNGNAARVDYVAELAADGTLKGNLLRNGSPSPITAVKQ